MPQEKLDAGKCYLIMSAGVIILAIGCFIIFWFYFLSNISEKTYGTVIGIQTSHTSKNYYYYPVVKFDTPDGKPVTFTSNVSNNIIIGYNTGEKVAVRYNKKNPNQAIINSINQLLYPLFISLFGLAIFLSGLKELLKKVKPKE